ncbi:MAG: carbohydrate-binding domain-containing protein [Prevotella sp.]|nr:carbohydrate-binding domain-containing protein [Prevotella sp.]
MGATKAIKADSTIVIVGGTITATTSGNSTYDSLKKDTSSPSAVKAGGAFTMTNGKLTATSTGSGGKGINATDDVTISGGKAYITTTGTVYEYSKDLDSKPQGIKSDGNIVISGGEVYVCAGSYEGNATAFKPGKSGAFYINGGDVIGVSRKKTEVSSASKQAWKNYSNVKVVGVQTLSYDGLSYTIPSNYSISSSNVVVSKAPTTTFSGMPRRLKN